MLVNALMTTAPLTIAPDLGVDAALELMHAEDIRHLPVVDAGRLVGVVSDRDLLEAAGPASAFDDTPREVRELMACEPATIGPQDTIVAAATTLLVDRIGCLPVLDDDGRLAGILTEMDLVVALAHDLPGLAGAPVATVDTLMSTELRLLTPDCPVGDAWEAMRKHRVRHLPVVQDGALAGLLTDRDVRRALAAVHPGSLPVSELMSTETLHVVSGTSVQDAAQLMALAKVSCLPVKRGTQLVGLLTLTDVLEHCLEHLRDPED